MPRSSGVWRPADRGSHGGDGRAEQVRTGCPRRTGRTAVTFGWRCTGAYRSALLSNFATGWSLFGLRFALVPLFVEEVLDRQPATSPAGPPHRRRQRGGGDVQRPALRSDRAQTAVDRGLVLSAVTTLGWGWPPRCRCSSSRPLSPARRRASTPPAAGGRRRHHRQGPGRHRRGGLPDDVRLRSIVGSFGGACWPRSFPTVGLSASAVPSCWWPRSAGCCWLRRPATRFRGAGGLARVSGGPEAVHNEFVGARGRCSSRMA